VDGYVLLPGRLAGDALRALAGTDADVAALARAQACWKALLAGSGVAVPVLGFAHPRFKAGRNLTVRRGRRWLQVPLACIDSVADTPPLLVALQARVYRFDALCDADLADEHDPLCRHVAGLLGVLQAVYPGFCSDEEVTLLSFDMPEGLSGAASAPVA
jgi:hypothetical protein